MSKLIYVKFTAIMIIALLTGFSLGVARTRAILTEAAEDLASGPTNSFAKCLTESWEQTNELDPDWKGHRKWVLTE